MTTATGVRVQLLHPDAVVPGYARPGDGGADLTAVARVVLAPGQRALVPTGIAPPLPDGHVGLVHPRSGLAHRHGITVVNAPGTIDAGYRGEVMVNLINLDPTEAFTVEPGDRIAQLVIQRFEHAVFEVVDALGATERGAGGHGSTGTRPPRGVSIRTVRDDPR